MNTAKLTVLGVSILLLTAAGCELDEVEEGRLPDVNDRTTDAGQVPELDERRTPDVDMNNRARELPEFGADRPAPEFEPRPDDNLPANEEIEVPDRTDQDRGLDGVQETDR